MVKQEVWVKREGNLVREARSISWEVDDVGWEVEDKGMLVEKYVVKVEVIDPAAEELDFFTAEAQRE